jgi:Universal stress protein family
MQKILFVSDGLKVDIHTVDFACYLSTLTKSRITGVFLENLVANERAVLKNGYDATYLEWEVDENSPEYQEKMKLIEQNITLFKEACAKREVSCDVYRDSGVPAREIIGESRFADLLIVDAETSFNRKYEGNPTEFVKEILKKAECPVVIAPESFQRIDELIFCYDGSRSALFSIKQFEYLLPELLNSKKSILVEVNKENEMSIVEKHKIKEWFVQHYADLRFEILHGDIKDELFLYLLKKKNAFVVMGAYGRGMISQLFKRSTADKVLKTTNLPVFITHH